MSLRLEGIGVSDGIGLAPCVFLKRKRKYAHETELSREQALHRYRWALETVENRIKREIGEATGEDRAILDAHATMLLDPEYQERIELHISEEGVSPAYAVERATQFYREMFEQMDNAYFRERAADLVDIGDRLIATILGEGESERPDSAYILVTDFLKPSDLIGDVSEHLLGVCSGSGGATSHAAILARSKGIPCVMGLGDAVDAIVTGESLIIDGAEGVVLRHADPAIQMQYREKERRLSIEREALQKLVDEKPSTRTGRRIEVACNIASGADMAGVLEVGADGVGLFRTEMLFMDRSTPPSEEEQTRVYRQVLSEADDRRVVIRTMDIGGDKPVSYLGIEAEENPFLGYRAIRYLMDHPELLITQFRALLRASDAGNLAIMIPMISHLEEIRWVKDLIQTVEKELEREGHGPFSYELGMMIEVPSAVMMADRFAREVDFFSIGTNDLTGYLLAADRMNSRVASIYDYWDPSVVRAIKRVIDAGKQERIWVGMCGGAAGDPAYAKLLLDLGLDELSTEPTRVLKLKSIIMAYTGEETAHRLSRVMEADTKEDVKAIYGS